MIRSQSNPFTSEFEVDRRSDMAIVEVINVRNRRPTAQSELNRDTTIVDTTMHVFLDSPLI